MREKLFKTIGYKLDSRLKNEKQYLDCIRCITAAVNGYTIQIIILKGLLITKHGSYDSSPQTGVNTLKIPKDFARINKQGCSRGAIFDILKFYK